ncbi:DNA mismatch endonuclease Vsr [Smaragdicoccus niigatensis]
MAVFVDGCFWHGCPEHYSRPRANQEFWDRKVAANIARDKETTARLGSEGWTAIRIWEHVSVGDAVEIVTAAVRTSSGSGPSDSVASVKPE